MQIMNKINLHKINHSSWNTKSEIKLNLFKNIALEDNKVKMFYQLS